MKPRVILYSMVREHPQILNLALESHAALEGVTDRWYWDDNDDHQSSALLSQQGAIVIPGETEAKPEYVHNEVTHKWNGNLISRLAKIRNYGIDRFIESSADYLFMCDADMVFHPRTVERLIQDDVPINSTLCWAKWTPGQPWLPNVWDRHPYSFKDENQIFRLKNKGVFEVGGTGTCYLFRRDALKEGIDFSPIESLLNVIWGEDRFIAIKAELCGVPLYVDTAYPSFHVYRPSMLPEASAWYGAGAPSTYFNQKWLSNGWEDEIRSMLKPKNG